MILLIGVTESSQIHRDRRQNSNYYGLGRGVSYCLVGRASVGDDEKVLKVDSCGGCTTL